MRIVVTGATGNLGTSVLRKLRADPAVAELVGVARRRPAGTPAKTRWSGADVAGADLVPVFTGADAVVHLAWAFEPAHGEEARWATNVTGTIHVLEAVRRAGVPVVVVMSAAAAYAPTPVGTPVGEDAPLGGVPTSSFARQKAAVEKVLDQFEAHHPSIRVVRLRPVAALRREAAGTARHAFLGPLLGGHGRFGLMPRVTGVRLQVVHAFDVADAVRLALLRAEARGAYNLAAPPVLGSGAVAAVLGRRLIRLPRRVVRARLDAGWRLRTHGVEPGWLDLLVDAPLVDARRAQAELGWRPAFSATAALTELAHGLRAGPGSTATAAERPVLPAPASPPAEPAATPPAG